MKIIELQHELTFASGEVMNGSKGLSSLFERDRQVNIVYLRERKVAQDAFPCVPMRSVTFAWCAKWGNPSVSRRT